MTRKIALSGSHATGKTTLLNKVASSLRPRASVEVVPEIARLMVEEAGDHTHLWRSHTTLSRQLLALTRQIELEALAHVNHPDFILCDRCVADHWVYTDSHFPEELSSNDGQQWLSLVRRWLRTYDTIFYLPVAFDMAADPIRESDREYQHVIDRKLLSFFNRIGKPVITMEGSTSERLEHLLERL